MKPTENPGSPLENTVTTALAEGRGSCAALIATALALTDGPDSAFQAVILRDHVLLGSRSSPDTYYEVLRAGEPLDSSALARHEPHPPGGPARVDSDAYLAYYLDNLAARLADVERPEEAEGVFRRALALSPRTPRILYNWGTFLLRTGRPRAAREQLQRAIRLGWKDADAFANRGTANWKLGHTRQARRDFERALELEPRHAQAARNLERLPARPGSR